MRSRFSGATLAEFSKHKFERLASDRADGEWDEWTANAVVHACSLSLLPIGKYLELLRAGEIISTPFGRYRIKEAG